MAKVLCATPRSGSTAIGVFLADQTFIKSYTEFCNPRYMQGLYGSEWGARRDEFMRDPDIGLKIMREHVTEELTPYIKMNGAILCTRMDKILQAVSYYFATSTGHWYKSDSRSARAPKFDFDKIKMHMDRIIMQEEAWVNYFMKYEIEFEVICYEEAITKRWINNSEREKHHLPEKVQIAYQFHNALWNRVSMEWANTFRGKWRGEKV